MSKLKALGVGILAVLAIGAFAAVNASAEPDEGVGHFVSEGSETENTTITGTEEGDHVTEFSIPGLTPIVCKNVLYEGTMETNTVTQLTITATYETCLTTEGEHNVTVDMNGCNYLFTIGDHAEADNTVHLKCPEGKQIEVTHPSCTISIPEQTLKGAWYTTDTTTVKEVVKHTITLDVTVEEITSHFEGGFCILLGTKHLGKLAGSVTVEGYEDLGNHEGLPHGTEGPLVNITATGKLDA